MFQKIKPVNQPEKKEESKSSVTSNDDKTTTKTSANDSKDTNNTANTTTTNKETKTMSESKKDNDVELDGLTKRSETGAYSPRPAATTSAGFSSFPGARSSNSSDSSNSSATPTPVASDRQLLIGKGINISGEIDACNHLVVEGQVDATLKGANILDIAESGTFYGSVEINEGSVAGRFEGDLKVEGRLTIRSTGVIIGSLQYGELAVEAGATIEGKIAPLSSSPATRSSSSKSSMSSSSKNSTPAKKASVSMDNELPFATKAS